MMARKRRDDIESISLDLVRGSVVSDVISLWVTQIVRHLHDTHISPLRAERDAYRATLLDIAAVKHPDQQRTPHQEMARECVRKWETGK